MLTLKHCAIWEAMLFPKYRILIQMHSDFFVMSQITQVRKNWLESIHDKA